MKQLYGSESLHVAVMNTDAFNKVECAAIEIMVRHTWAFDCNRL